MKLVKFARAIIFALGLFLLAFAHDAKAETGVASWYNYSHHKTANGGHVEPATAAHKFLPFGTRVLVTNLENHAQTVLTINDRGPFVRGRIIDVSPGGASALRFNGHGTARVSVVVTE